MFLHLQLSFFGVEKVKRIGLKGDLNCTAVTDIKL